MNVNKFLQMYLSILKCILKKTRIYQIDNLQIYLRKNRYLIRWNDIYV